MKSALQQIMTAMTLIGLVIATPGITYAGESYKNINLSDFDLNQAEEVATLYDRISFAARLVCRDGLVPWNGRQVTKYKECLQDTVDKVVTDINHHALSALHEGRSESVARR